MLGQYTVSAEARRRAITAAGILVLAGFSMPAFAQDNQGLETDAGGLSEIVVTAQKRNQNLQDIPVAVSAVSSEALASANITNAVDIGRIVPGFSVFSAGGVTQPFLRGIGSPTVVVGNESSVAVYIDGIYLVRVPASMLELNSIERVEVLKGPQGTLFGRNASGGLLHIITREPTSNPTVEGSIGYGNFGTIRGNVYASAGLAQGLAMDISAAVSNQAEGWGKNTANGQDWGQQNSHSIRSKLRWESDSTTIDLIGDYSKSKSDLLPHSNYEFGPPRGYDLPPFGLQPQLGFYDIEADSQPLYREKAWGVSGKIEHDLGFGKITSTTAYRKNNALLVFDSDFSGQSSLLANLYGRVKQFSQELQLASNTGGSFEWLVGAFYLNSKSGYYPSRFTGETINLAFGGLTGVVDNYGLTKDKSYAAYGQGTLKLGDRTGLTVGLRFTRDELSGQGRDDFYVLGNPVAGPVRTASKSFQKLTWKASVDHKITDDIMVYASQSRGCQRRRKSRPLGGAKPGHLIRVLASAGRA